MSFPHEKYFIFSVKKIVKKRKGYKDKLTSAEPERSTFKLVAWIVLLDLEKEAASTYLANLFNYIDRVREKSYDMI